MLERLEAWYEQTGKKLLSFLLVGIGIYLFLKYILRLVLPFIIAWGLSALLNPIVTWLKKVFRVPRGIGTLLSMLTVLSAFIGIITLIVTQIWRQVEQLAGSFDIYIADVDALITSIELQLQSLGDALPLPIAFNSLDDVIRGVMTYIGSFLDEIVRVVASVVASVPNGLFIFVVIILAVFFMTKDHRIIKDFVKAQIPERVTNKVVLMQQGLKNALGGYVKTQLILMTFTFTICLVGLFILQRDYALLIAIAIAVLDALPVFGSGAVLIPWAIYYIITGDYLVGIGLLAVYAIIVVMRQIMEPKVLSTQIGIYALVTLMAMYVGVQLIGVFGMILGPIVVVMFRTCQTIGVIPDFKKPSQKE